MTANSRQILTNFRFADVDCRGLPRRRPSPSSRRSFGSLMNIAQIFSRLSVRARIIVLGVIPLIGFVATGIAFVTGDAEVGRAFDSVKRDTEVADASRDLKTGLLMMRAGSTQFVDNPSDAEVKYFDDGQMLAMQCLDRIEAEFAASEYVLNPLRT